LRGNERRVGRRADAAPEPQPQLEGVPRMNRLLVFLVAVAAAIVALVPASSAASSSSSDSQASSAWLQRAVFASTAETQAQAGRTSQVTGSLPTWRNLYDWPTSGQGYVGWHSSTTAPDDYGMQAALGGQYGLWLWPLGGHKTYDTKDYAQWTYTAPGTTRLESVQLSYEWPNKLLAHHCIDFGFLDGAGNVVTRQEACKPPPQSPLTITLTDPSSNPTSKVLYFRIHVDCGGASSCSKTIPSKDPLKNGAYARLLRADMTLVDDDNPLPEPSGAFYELDESYIDGRQSYPLTVTSSDAGSGIIRSWVERDGDGQVVSSDAPCDPSHNTAELDNRICPATYAFLTSIDTNQFPEGKNVFVAKAVDVAGNVGPSHTWVVFIDRTPPTPATNIKLDAFDSSSQTALIAWDSGSDPALPDGSLGSGALNFSYRYRVDGGAWTDWDFTDESDFQLENAQLGQNVDVEVQSYDAVGNDSPVASGSATIYDAGGDVYPFSSPDEDPGTTRTLTDGEVASASSTAQTDPVVRALIGSRATSVSNVMPWTAPNGAVIGAELTLSWNDPASIEGDWPILQMTGDGSTYETQLTHETATNVFQLDLLVDLGSGRVVSVEPSGDGSFTNQPSAQQLALLRPVRWVGGIEPATHRVASAEAAADSVPAALPRNLKKITSHLVPALAGDYFWNYDFRSTDIPPRYRAKAIFNADWPVTLIFYGNADVQTAKDLWNRGLITNSPKYLASPMHTVVRDKPDPGDAGRDHVQPRSGVWDTDHGSYHGHGGCYGVDKWHYRVYAPGPDNGGDNRMYSPDWGFYVVGTTHIDHNEWLWDCWPFGSQWSGRSEDSERHVADSAVDHTATFLKQWNPGYSTCETRPDPWGLKNPVTHKTGMNTLNLYNPDHRGHIGGAIYQNDGLATMIHVPHQSHPVCTP